jgi:hypothetical protein
MVRMAHGVWVIIHYWLSWLLAILFHIGCPLGTRAPLPAITGIGHGVIGYWLLLSGTMRHGHHLQPPPPLAHRARRTGTPDPDPDHPDPGPGRRN